MRQVHELPAGDDAQLQPDERRVAIVLLREALLEVVDTRARRARAEIAQRLGVAGYWEAEREVRSNRWAGRINRCIDANPLERAFTATTRHCMDTTLADPRGE